MSSRSLRAALVCTAVLALIAIPHADSTPQPLPFAQDWTTASLINVDDNWANVPGIVGYRGDGMTGGTGVDPRTVLTEGTLVTDVIANQTNPNTLATGGVAEFEIANPVVALQGSGTARAPHLVITVSTQGLSTIQVVYNVRDVDGSADNAVQPVALQYRVGTSGLYTNVPAAFIADATTGGAATLVTPVNVTLPADVENQPVVQLRIITTDAVGSDEWVGIDDLRVTGSIVPQPTNPTGLATATPSSVAVGGATLLTVAVNPGTNPPSTGLTVAADLSSIGGSATQPFLDDGTNGDAVAGDGTYSFNALVPVSTTPGAKALNVTVSDAQARSSATTIALTVTAPAPKGVVISQVYGGGGNSGAPLTNDFVELFNRSASAVNLTGWSVQYASANGTSWQVTALNGTIQPNSYYLVREAGGSNGVALPPAEASGGIAMSATSGKVALANTTTALSGGCPLTSAPVADLVGYGAASCFEGHAPADALSNTTAAVRLNLGDVDTDDNASDFFTGAPTPHNASGVPPTGTADALPQSVGSGGSALLTIRVTPGSRPVNTEISVTADLSSIGGASNAVFADNGANGDPVAHDNVFSLSTVVTGTSGIKTLPVQISDTVPRTGLTTLRLAIETTTATAIHDIQGPGSSSPLVNGFVTTRGIVTALKFNGVFIQARDGEADADERTSEGLFVFTGAAPAPYLATGQELFVSGTVREFVPSQDPTSPPTTELGDPFFRVASNDQPLPQPVRLLASYTRPDGGVEQLERFEGMRVAADLVAIAPTQGTAIDEVNARSTSTGVFYAVLQGIARPMREPGVEPGQFLPPDAPANIPRFDGNPERLRVDSDALVGAPAIDIVAGQVLTGATGALDFGFGTYMIDLDPPSVSGTPWVPTGNAVAVPVPAPSAGEFTVGHYNLERFFDDADDPDVEEDPVLTPAALEGRLAKASLAIRHVLRAPDILGVVEVENLPVLQRLAARISADAIAAGEADPQYEASLEEGNDVGGIDVGFLVKRAGGRVDVTSVTQVGRDATYTPPAGGTALLNDRPSLVLDAALTGPAGTRFPVTVIVNHLRSLSGIDGSDGARIRAKRRAQAEFLANYIQSRQTAHPEERIISVGDYNAFPFNDGYVDVMGTIEGRPAPPDAVLLASDDLVNPDLTNVVDLLPAAERYSFSFDGNAQAIDHVLVNEAVRRWFTRMAYARLDADFPEAFRGDVTRPERLSDHDAAIAYFAFPEAPVVTLNGANPMVVEAFTSFTDPGATAVDRGATPDQDRPLSVSVEGAVDVNTPGTYTLVYTATNGFFETRIERTVIVADRIAPAIDGFSVTPTSVWPPSHQMIDVTLSYVASDASGVGACVPSVTSNEAPNGRGDGNTGFDSLVLNSRHVQVRAERAGTSRDRIYTIALTCTDGSGNSTTDTRTVVVPRRAGL